MESLPGRLLIAGASLVDPNFRRTVVLVGEHTEEGALALPEHVSKVAAAAPTGQRDEVVEHVSFLGVGLNSDYLVPRAGLEPRPRFDDGDKPGLATEAASP
jgi:hypothetical protein